MGFSHEAYVAYGVRIPVHPYHYDDTGRGPGEQVDQALSVPTLKAFCPEVGHLQAGDYDADFFFVVTKCDSATLGAYTRIVPDEDTRDWDVQLERFLEVMGWDRLFPDLEPPSWFVVADMS
jgi:hypothetical protein